MLAFMTTTSFGCALFQPPVPGADAAARVAVPSRALVLADVVAGNWSRGELRALGQRLDDRTPDADSALRAEVVTALLVLARLEAERRPGEASASIDRASALTGCAGVPLDLECFQARVGRDLSGHSESANANTVMRAAWSEAPPGLAALANSESSWRLAARALVVRRIVGAARSQVLLQSDADSALALAAAESLAGDAGTRNPSGTLSPWREGPAGAVADAAAALGVAVQFSELSIAGGAFADSLHADREALAAVSLRGALRPSDLTSIALRPPRMFGECDAGAVAPSSIVLLLRSSGVYLPGRPSLSIERDGRTLTVVATEVPQTQLLAFDGPGRLPVDALDGAMLPALRDALAERDAEGQPISIVVDGNVYFSTLRAVLHTLAQLDIARPRLLGVAENRDLFVSVPIDVSTALEPVHHALMMRSDGYFVRPYDETGLGEQHSITLTAEAPLLEVARLLEDLFDSGRARGDLSLTVIVDDPTADVGVLFHLLDAIVWRRDLVMVDDDLSFLRAAPSRVDGVPRALVPAGVRLSY
ncbi:MAG: hypothetical protein ACI81R_001930 [Bradymonadia bacterium]|jgi:hypothetical protein